MTTGIVWKCPRCGFEFSLATDYSDLTEEERKAIVTCLCGAKMKVIKKTIWESEETNVSDK